MNEGLEAPRRVESERGDSYDEQIAAMRETIDNLEAALIHISPNASNAPSMNLPNPT